MATVDDLKRIANIAIQHVDAIMGPHGGADNKRREIRDTVKVNTGFDEFDKHVTETRFNQVELDLWNRIDMIRKEFHRAHPEGFAPWNLGKLNLLARLAIKHRAGQCTEQVAIAFHHLRVAGVKTLDVMYLLPPGDHLFLILNRVTPEAVVCDPWSPWKYSRVYPVTDEKLKLNLGTHHRGNWQSASAFTWRA